MYECLLGDVTHMEVKCILEKLDLVLKSNTSETIYLLNKINQYYNTMKKKNTEIIEYDFKKREIIAFWEILKDDLGEGF